MSAGLTPGRPRRLGLRGTGRGGRDVQGVAGRQAPHLALPGLLEPLDAGVLLRADRGGGPAGGQRVRGRHPVPDRLGGGAGPAVRRDRRRARGPPRPRPWLAARREGVDVRSRRGGAERGAAGGVPAGAADDRVAAGGGHQGDGRQDQGRGAVADRGLGDRRRGAVGPGERVRPLHDHPAGVRPPALRGRQHPVRPPVGQPAQERDRRAGRAACAQPAGPRPVRLRPHQRRHPGQRDLRPRGGLGQRADPAAARLRPPAARRVLMARAARWAWTGRWTARS